MDIIARNHIHVIGNLDAAQTLMFAHGFGIDQTSFSQVTPSFESDYKIVLFDNVGGGSSEMDRPELAAAFAENLSAIRPDIAVQVAKAIFYLDYRAELPKVTLPTLVVQTANDIAVPAVVSEYLEAHIPNSRRVKVQTEGHFPHVSAPQEVVAAIQSFL
jgi:sigma-B regulation protein RsbQ